VSGKHAGSLLAMAMVLAMHSPASAQVYIGGDGLPANSINQSVLDSLGEPVSLSEMFMGGRAPAAPVMTMPAAFIAPDEAPIARRLQHQKSVTLTQPKPHRGTVTVTAVKATKPEKIQAETPAPSDMTEEAPAPTVASPAKVAEAAPAKVLPVIVPKVEKAPEVVAAKPAPVAPPAPTPAPAPVVASAAPTPLTPEPAPAPTPAPAPVVAAPPPAPAPAPVVVAPPPAPVAPAPMAPAPVVAAAPASSAVPVAPPLATPAPQQASAPVPVAAVVGLGDGGATIPFEKDAAHLQPGALAALAAMASRMASDDGLQVQLMAYADGDEDSAGKARRLSLSRALAVRSYLIDQGVRSTRIEVRALGNKVPDGPPDRVDVVVQRR